MLTAGTESALAGVFGFDELRPGQAEIITDVLEGRPVVAVMPTGAGKSLCYQLPAVMLGEAGGVTLVVSPLIALMKDQVDGLTARGIAAAALTSAASPEEQREILDGIRAGVFTLVYVAPERFRSGRFVDALEAARGRLALLAIDEAHCISEWGHDFRPDYRRLGEAVKRLRPARLAAFTATATPEVRRDIAAQLGMTDARFHVRGFDRPNLHYSVEAVAEAAKGPRLVELVRMREGGVALVYAATRKNAEKHAGELARSGMRVGVYHAGLDDAARVKVQDAFMAGRLDAVVATNAFGMGVDKSDIRLVVHADVPRSPEAYYQEAGRGGRDGRPTRCVLLFNHRDARVQEFLIDASYPTAEVLRATWKLIREHPHLGSREGDREEKLKGRLPGDPHASTIGSALRILERHGLLRDDMGHLVATRPDPGVFPALDVEALARRAEVERKKLKTMIDYAYWTGCRRQYVLAYFGDADWRDRGRRCGGCDSCEALAAGKQVGLGDAEVKAIRGLLLLIGSLNGRFGRTRIAAIATATDDDGRFDELVERGCLKGWSQKDVMDLIRALEGAGLVEASRGEYPTLDTTRRGDQVAVGRIDPVELGIRMPARGGARKRKRGPRSRPGLG
jgi:ATP-dependent DNA helicase RecQ